MLRLVLFVLMVVCPAIAAKADTEAEANAAPISPKMKAKPEPAPGAKWTWKAPVVVDENVPPVHPEEPWQQRPQFFWTAKGVLLAHQRGSLKQPPHITLYRRSDSGTWRRLATVKDLAGQVHRMLLVGDDLCFVVEKSGPNTRVFRFQRISHGKKLPPAKICEGPHVRFLGAVADGSAVSVFFTKHSHDSSERQVQVLRSADGGKSWPRKPTVVTTDVTPMTRLPGPPSAVACRLAPQHLIVLTAAPKGGVTLHRSTDGGNTWRAEPLKLPDGIKVVVPPHLAGQSADHQTRDVKLRQPFECFPWGRAIGMVYVAYAGYGRLYRLFTWSLDLGRTWQRPVSQGRVEATTDSEAQTRTAAAGSHILTSVAEVEVAGPIGGRTLSFFSWPVTTSSDGGRTWQRSWRSETFMGVRGRVRTMGVTAAPSGNCILLAAVVETGPKNATRRKLVVRKLSPAVPPEKTPNREKDLKP